MPSELEAAALRHRSQLLRQEREAASAMVEAYGQAWQRVHRRLDEVLQQIDEARAQGLIVDTFTPRAPGGPVVARTPGTFSPAWLFERDRLQALLAQIEAELRQFAQFADGAILAQQQAAVQAAQANSAALLERAAVAAGRPELAGVFDRLPRDAVQDLVGFTSDGSPLRRLLDDLGPQVGDGVRNALTTAVATGMGPRETAQLVRRQFGMGLRRALTIARTEQLRAYREAARRTYATNSAVLEGWTWLSGADGRTCPSCLAMHGTVHPVTEGLDSHPNCRCTMVPQVKGAEGPQIQTGDELFAEMPEAQQRRLLGPAAFEAYKAGAVRLADFVGVKDDSVWGRHRYVKSLKDVIGRDRAKEYVSWAAKDAKLSQHETDLLIRRIIRTGRNVSDADLRQVVARVTQALPDSRSVATGELKGTKLHGREVQERDAVDWVHLVQRIVVDEQWAPDVTPTEYWADVRRVAEVATQIAFYLRRGGSVVLFAAKTRDVVPAERLGADVLPEIVMIYSADRGIIVSGYQASGLDQVAIPGDAQWVRR